MEKLPEDAPASVFASPEQQDMCAGLHLGADPLAQITCDLQSLIKCKCDAWQ